MVSMSSAEPDRTREAQPQTVPAPEAGPETGGGQEPLLTVRGLVALGSEDAPACSDGICL